jgi:hypothetical protein
MHPSRTEARDEIFGLAVRPSPGRTISRRYPAATVYSAIWGLPLIHAAANLASFLLGKHPQSLGLHALHRIRCEK